MNPTMRSGAVAVLAAVTLTTASLTAVPAASAATGAKAAGAQATAPTPPAFAPPDAQERRNARASADNALSANPSKLLRKSGNDKFKLLRSVAGTRGLQYLTYQRTHRGLPVYGGDVIVATDKTGQSVDTVVTGQQATVDVDTKAAVTAAAATATARAQLASVEEAATPALLVHATTDTPAWPGRSWSPAPPSRAAPACCTCTWTPRTGR
ncbi:hypothetical protein [Sphaerimonospora thailandensis]|uniref:FTP domain-containing protein n=1 Tax=Sphaerimonospora thailandensis TaxID=795644 RepID=A0A8J3RJP5_9ACTN|nr:hypothetical protein [Sphaerimonospora thailandensis]GIH73558.1 hypothetical protein Mth01_58110 [Sphaerimonospora thailandensis]